MMRINEVVAYSFKASNTGVGIWNQTRDKIKSVNTQAKLKLDEIHHA